MEIGAIFLLFALLILVGLYVSGAFTGWHGHQITENEHKYSELMAEYDRVLNSLQELEYDNILKKIPAEDYPRQRVELLQKGSALLSKLDAYQVETSDQDLKSRLEAMPATRISNVNKHLNYSGILDDDLESLISARRSTRKEKSGGFCPKCGKPILHSDSFCPTCGIPIERNGK